MNNEPKVQVRIFYSINHDKVWSKASHQNRPKIINFLKWRTKHFCMALFWLQRTTGAIMCSRHPQAVRANCWLCKTLDIDSIYWRGITSTSLSSTSVCVWLLFLQASSKMEDVSTLRIFHFPGDFSTSQIDVELENVGHKSKHKSIWKVSQNRVCTTYQIEEKSPWKANLN